MTERYKLCVDVQLLLIKDGKVLLLLRQNTGYQDGNYGLPAGHVEPNENIASAMIREAEEEAGIKLQESDLEFDQVMHRKSTPDYVTFFFKVLNYNGPKPRNTEPEKCLELKWFDLNDLPPNIISWVKLGITNSRNNIVYSEPDFE